MCIPNREIWGSGVITHRGTELDTTRLGDLDEVCKPIRQCTIMIKTGGRRARRSFTTAEPAIPGRRSLKVETAMQVWRGIANCGVSSALGMCMYVCGRKIMRDVLGVILLCKLKPYWRDLFRSSFQWWVGERGNGITEVWGADREKLPRSGAATAGLKGSSFQRLRVQSWVTFKFYWWGLEIELKESISKHYSRARSEK